MDTRESEAPEENTIVLKGRFKAVDTNAYGLLIIFLSQKLRNVENLLAIASHYSSLYDTDPHLPWYSLEETIVNLKWKGDIAVNISIDLQNYMESSLDQDRGNELYMLLQNNDQTKIESLLQAILIKPLSDRNVVLETVTETISNEVILSRRAERNKQRIAAKEDYAQKKSEADGYIPVDLILAPVSGIPIYELSSGDKIMVRINDKSLRGKYFIDMLGARVDGNVIPVPVEVTHISKDSNNEYTILCKITEKAVGKAIESEQVKLKRYDDLFEQGTPLREIALDEQAGKKSFPMFIVVVGSLMFVILLVFIIMWFYDIL
jgi:hypothetical protein